VNSIAAGGRLLPIFTSRENKTGRHTLQVPFERRRAGLIKVIDVEDEAPVRRGVSTKVAYMGIPADLRKDAGAGQGSEIRSHDRRGSAKETERRNKHALVLHSDQGRNPSPHRASDGCDR
jgi:hypothetical protein